MIGGILLILNSYLIFNTPAITLNINFRYVALKNHDKSRSLSLNNIYFVWQKMPLMKYQLLILDFDGTIADTRESIVQTMALVAEKMSLNHYDETLIRQHIGLPLRSTFENVFHLDETEISEATRLYRQHYNTVAINTVSLFKNVKNTLIKLHQTEATLAIASNKGKDALIEILKKQEIYDLFTFIGGEGDVKNKKPAPDIVNLILDKLNFTPKDCLVIGDTIFDVEMGQRASTATCAVTYGAHSKEELIKQNPDYMIEDFEGLLKII